MQAPSSPQPSSDILAAMRVREQRSSLPLATRQAAETPAPREFSMTGIREGYLESLCRGD
jgi:hypothetical protein